MEASEQTQTQKVLNKEDAFNHYAKFWNLDFEYWDIQLILKTFIIAQIQVKILRISFLVAYHANNNHFLS
jgi:hypothetical protein